MIDTGFYRYFVEKNTEPSLKRSSRSFWVDASLEVESGNAVILVAEDVEREMEVQSFSHVEMEKRKATEFLEIVKMTSPQRVSQEIEHLFRKMNAYVKTEFRAELNEEPLFKKIRTYTREIARGLIREDFFKEDNTSYGDILDARTIYSAYEEDAILVTANIKDFLLYPLLFPVNQERLYDLKKNKPFLIPEPAYRAIHNDETFKGYLAEFFWLNGQ